MPNPTPEQRLQAERNFVLLLSLVAVALSLIPALRGLVGAPAGSRYLGYQYNFDDHMVYAAWMRQAMDGRLLFDNRFAVDNQPGLTIHVYFLLLGWLAKLVGIPAATALARAGFSLAFVQLAYRLVRKLTDSVFATKLALGLVVFGGGIGYLVWHNFGLAITRPELQAFAPPMKGLLPTDVWQPEGYVFPSMLTNSLFMVSLCLIVGIFLCVLAAKDNAKAVLPGFAGMALLMNIHSYDVLLVTLALGGFLGMQLAQKQAPVQWILRVVCMGLGALLPALWFMYVLKHDPVFQARAATETYSPNFRQVAFGYLPLLAMGLLALWRQKGGEWRTHAALAAAGLVAILFFAAGTAGPGYWMELGPWLGLLLGVYALLALLATTIPAWNLTASWALVGLIAPYFPALFQRKLAMGLAVPWAILAGLAIASFIVDRDRGSRNLATALGLLIACGSSLRWLAREVQLASLNVSNTTVHSVYLSSDASKILDYLEQHRTARTVVLALPGIPSPGTDSEGKPVPDTFNSPFVSDLNPVLSGLAGVYTFAGHWSETPAYNARRGMVSSAFTGVGRQMTPADLKAMVERTGANYLVAPVPEAFRGLPLRDLTSLGKVVYDGAQFKLIEVQP